MLGDLRGLCHTATLLLWHYYSRLSIRLHETVWLCLSSYTSRCIWSCWLSHILHFVSKLPLKKALCLFLCIYQDHFLHRCFLVMKMFSRQQKHNKYFHSKITKPKMMYISKKLRSNVSSSWERKTFCSCNAEPPTALHIQDSRRQDNSSVWRQLSILAESSPDTVFLRCQYACAQTGSCLDNTRDHRES